MRPQLAIGGWRQQDIIDCPLDGAQKRATCWPLRRHSEVAQPNVHAVPVARTRTGRVATTTCSKLSTYRSPIQSDCSQVFQPKSCRATYAQCRVDLHTHSSHCFSNRVPRNFWAPQRTSLGVPPEIVEQTHDYFKIPQNVARIFVRQLEILEQSQCADNRLSVFCFVFVFTGRGSSTELSFRDTVLDGSYTATRS